jgi:hypothetical protein
MSIAISGSSITFPDQTQMSTATGGSFRNRIINGDMRIDQRNAGAAVTVTSTATYIYATDRYINFNNTGTSYTAQQVADAPAGFVNSTKLTFGSSISLSTTNEAVFQQIIEGFNVSDLAWGTASASSIALSFWVKASFTGISSVGFSNDGGTRVYATTYTITAPNIWEYKTVVVPGDTSGTWLTNNMQGLHVRFQNIAGSNFQVAANDAWATRSGSFNASDSIFGTKAVGSPTSVSAGATWQITGVQLEQGSTATEFERRPIGTELALCQRYYEILTADTEGVAITSFLYTGTHSRARWFFKTTKRTIPPTVGLQSGSWINVTPTIYRSADSVGFSNTSGNFASNTTLFAEAEL